jgi:ABC-type proline/glycine betaine transport system ATPase subunit
MVFQKYSLYPWLNAAENVAFGMRLQRMKAAEIKERTAYFLEVVGLSDATTKLPRELSGGMQQRVAIARALATNPSILLLDEPCSAIDPPTREHLLKVMRDQAEAGQTLLVSSHDWGSALDSYDQVVVMDGQILANGSPDTVREKLSDLTCMMGSSCCG